MKQAVSVGLGCSGRNEHLGIIKNWIEYTEGPEINAWAPALKNYTFTENLRAMLLLMTEPPSSFSAPGQ